jgi:hypothetical protein
MDAQGFVKAYKDELKGLEGPDKAKINMLTMLAEDNKQHAQAIVDCIEHHLREVCCRASKAGSFWWWSAGTFGQQQLHCLCVCPCPGAAYCGVIGSLICACLLFLQCKPQGRLPALYLMDSIIKNVREPYKSLFSKNIDKVGPHGAACGGCSIMLPV